VRRVSPLRQRSETCGLRTAPERFSRLRLEGMSLWDSVETVFRKPGARASAPIQAKASISKRAAFDLERETGHRLYRGGPS
jgi:hypothetical protein